MTTSVAVADFARAVDRDLALARELPPELLAILLRAARYAQDASRPAWDFAVEIDQLRLLGVSDCDLRWLLCKGLVEHALETSRRPCAARTFHHVPAFTFDARSSFILTLRGIRLAHELLACHTLPSGEMGARELAGERISPAPAAKAPYWDGQRRELRVGRIVIKRFCVPALNQETVLTAFQEEDWPPRIDDPLPPVPEIDPKRRLHSTIQCLNRNQKTNLVQFHGNGCGTGVRWELLAAGGIADE